MGTDAGAARPAGWVASRPLLLQVLHWLVDPQGAPAGGPPQIGHPPGFLQAVRRHRLAIPLARHADVLSLPASLADPLVREARHQQRASLALIALALEAQAALEQAGLRALLLKGPALAVQTTGVARGRGGGDLDLLVAPEDLPAVVALLEGLGFHRPPGMFPRRLDSFWGRYARWTGHELSLERPGSPCLDLHWGINTVRAPLPPFEALWQARQTVNLNGRAVPTLSLEHAFRHSCLHAASDQWMTLHHLLDVALLARQLPPATGPRLRRERCVRHSCAAAYDATGCSALLAFTDPGRPDCRRAIARARWTQERPPRVSAEGAWHPGHWLATVRQQASLSSSPLDWLRVVARFSVLPAAFNDPLTGEDRGLLAMVQARSGRLRERLAERR
ncbi:MAG: nucleotidyltransferase family protein [Cyanobacteriota bacterium]|nr:nucleotidyltransferase family protein [Cyanobacteriota bacterium]